MLNTIVKLYVMTSVNIPYIEIPGDFADTAILFAIDFCMKLRYVLYLVCAYKIHPVRP